MFEAEEVKNLYKEYYKTVKKNTFLEDLEIYERDLNAVLTI